MNKTIFVLGALIIGLAADLFAQDPALLRVALVATTLNADSEKFLDTVDGVASARGAGVPVVAVATNLPAGALRAAGAAAVVPSLAGLAPERLAELAGLFR